MMVSEKWLGEGENGSPMAEFEEGEWEKGLRNKRGMSSFVSVKG